jgi:type I restriction enzyme S subunit
VMVLNPQSSHWKSVSLEQLLESAQSGFASGERDPDGTIQVRMNNVTTDGNLDWTSFIRVPTSQKHLDKYQLQQGDVLFNNTNSPELVGKTTAFDSHTEPVVFSNHFIRLRVDETKLDPWYLARWLTKQWQLKVFERLCTRWVNQASVRKDDLLALEVPLPPLPEQQRIAEVLSKADRLRRLRCTARELSDTYLQSVFLEMFGDPVSNPREWEIKEVGSQIRSIRYGTGSPPLYQEEGIPFIRATNIKGGTIQTEGLVHISKDAAKEIAKCKVSAGDLILVRSGVNTGDCALIPPEYDGAYAAYDLIIEVSYPQNYYYNFIINSGYGKSIIQPLSRRTGQPHINAEQVKSLQFPSPPTSLQKEFAK